MTVKELIARLLQLPEELEVVDINDSALVSAEIDESDDSDIPTAIVLEFDE